MLMTSLPASSPRLLTAVGALLCGLALGCSSGTKTSSTASSSSSSTGGGATSTAGTTSQAAGSSAVETGSSQEPASSGARASSSRASLFGDGGFVLPDGGIDAGVQPYSGTPEPGVVCGVGVICVADAGSKYCCSSPLTGGSQCGNTCSLALGVACDGPEDCPSSQVCCFQGLQQGAVCSDTCVPTGALTGPRQFCNHTQDCPAGWGCCESATLKGYLPGLDFGACVEGCNL